MSDSGRDSGRDSSRDTGPETSLESSSQRVGSLGECLDSCIGSINSLASSDSLKKQEPLLMSVLECSTRLLLSIEEHCRTTVSFRASLLAQL